MMRVQRVCQCLPPIKSPFARFADNVASTAIGIFRRCLPSTRLASDVFEHQMTIPLSEISQINQPLTNERLERLFKFPYTLFSRENLDALSPKNYGKILRYAAECDQLEKIVQEPVNVENRGIKIAEFTEKIKNGPKNPKDVENIEAVGKIEGFYQDVSDIGRYGKFILASLRKMFSDKKMKVIGIGQSPATIVEYLSLNGIDTALCPASELTKWDDTVKKLCFSKQAETYFQYLKNFGLDVDAIDSRKTHVFIDFEVSGRSLKNFKELISTRLPKKTDTMFVSLQSLRESMNKEISLEEQEFASKFEGMSLWTCALKSLYSPIFRLPVEEFGNIAHIHKKSCPSKQTVAFNKLKVLLYDALFGKTRNPQN